MAAGHFLKGIERRAQGSLSLRRRRLDERCMGAGQLFAAGSQSLRPPPCLYRYLLPSRIGAHKIINGDKLSEYLIDMNGQGACFLDYNNDGFQDIFLVNGTSRKLEAAGQHPHVLPVAEQWHRNVPRRNPRSSSVRQRLH
jgi:hypothetical protein